MDLEDLRLAVYRAFATAGRAPDAEELAGQLHVQPSKVSDGLRTAG